MSAEGEQKAAAPPEDKEFEPAFVADDEGTLAEEEALEQGDHKVLLLAPSCLREHARACLPAPPSTTAPRR